MESEVEYVDHQDNGDVEVCFLDFVLFEWIFIYFLCVLGD